MEKWKVFYILLVSEGFVIGLVSDICIGWKISPILGVIFVWGILLLTEYRNYKEHREKEQEESEESLKFLERGP